MLLFKLCCVYSVPENKLFILNFTLITDSIIFFSVKVDSLEREQQKN